MQTPRFGSRQSSYMPVDQLDEDKTRSFFRDSRHVTFAPMSEQFTQGRFLKVTPLCLPVSNNSSPPLTPQFAGSDLKFPSFTEEFEEDDTRGTDTMETGETGDCTCDECVLSMEQREWKDLCRCALLEDDKASRGCWMFKTKKERDKVMWLADQIMDRGNKFHTRLLSLLSKHLKGGANAALVGDHWLDLGFKTVAPFEDALQKFCGVMSVLHVLGMIANYHSTAVTIYKESKNELHPFPFFSTSYEITLKAVNLYLSGRLSKECKKRTTSTSTSGCLGFDVILEVYCAIFLEFSNLCILWRSSAVEKSKVKTMVMKQLDYDIEHKKNLIIKKFVSSRLEK